MGTFQAPAFYINDTELRAYKIVDKPVKGN